jgi:hypothetical protein
MICYAFSSLDANELVRNKVESSFCCSTKQRNKNSAKKKGEEKNTFARKSSFSQIFCEKHNFQIKIQIRISRNTFAKKRGKSRNTFARNITSKSENKIFPSLLQNICGEKVPSRATAALISSTVFPQLSIAASIGVTSSSKSVTVFLSCNYKTTKQKQHKRRNKNFLVTFAALREHDAKGNSVRRGQQVAPAHPARLRPQSRLGLHRTRQTPTTTT